MAWLLDTNILSELRRPKPEPKVVAFVAAQPLEALHLSVVTLAELRFGIESLSEVDRRATLNDWLTHYRGSQSQEGRLVCWGSSPPASGGASLASESPSGAQPTGGLINFQTRRALDCPSLAGLGLSRSSQGEACLA